MLSVLTVLCALRLHAAVAILWEKRKNIDFALFFHVYLNDNKVIYLEKENIDFVIQLYVEY